jgi:hypothetical protein
MICLAGIGTLKTVIPFKWSPFSVTCTPSSMRLSSSGMIPLVVQSSHAPSSILYILHFLATNSQHVLSCIPFANSNKTRKTVSRGPII